VYVDIDAVRLYLAGKASVQHAGVLWPRTKMILEMTMDIAVAVSIPYLFQHK
jgi:hypothetical protein